MRVPHQCWKVTITPCIVNHMSIISWYPFMDIVFPFQWPCLRLLNLRTKITQITLTTPWSNYQYTTLIRRITSCSKCLREPPLWWYFPKNRNSTEKTCWNGISIWRNYWDRRDLLGTLTEVLQNPLHPLPRRPPFLILLQFTPPIQIMTSGLFVTNSPGDTSRLIVQTLLDWA